MWDVVLRAALSVSLKTGAAGEMWPTHPIIGTFWIPTVWINEIPQRSHCSPTVWVN
jgi:hypothetical protein